MEKGRATEMIGTSCNVFLESIVLRVSVQCLELVEPVAGSGHVGGPGIANGTTTPSVRIDKRLESRHHPCSIPRWYASSLTGILDTCIKDKYEK